MKKSDMFRSMWIDIIERPPTYKIDEKEVLIWNSKYEMSVKLKGSQLMLMIKSKMMYSPNASSINDIKDITHYMIIHKPNEG